MRECFETLVKVDDLCEKTINKAWDVLTIISYMLYTLSSEERRRRRALASLVGAWHRSRLPPSGSPHRL
jgi:hypothetical protein